MTRVIIPWRGGCPHREAALDWLTGRFGDWEPRISEPPEGPWSKGAAVAAAADGLDHDTVVVVHDADVWSPGTTAAVEAVKGGAPWAVPHRGVHRLTEHATSHVLAGADPDHDLEHSERAYTGLAGGGIVVLTAATLRRVPLDRRFEGWGGEDHSWGIALETLTGRSWRGKHPLWHLWHPPQHRLTRKVGSAASHQLFRRYHAARDNPAAMTALIEEGRV